jgi:N-acetylmuramoyl-L-alanine amidase
MKIINANLKYKNPPIPLDPNKVEFIFIHHTASITATPEQIHQWHLSNGWSGAGYNEYITKDGVVHILRGDHIGAHASKHNSISYGICLEGNYDIEPEPSAELYRIVAERVVANQEKYKKAKTILPHSARVNTSCPGKNFSMGKLYDAINKIYKEGEKMGQIKTTDEAIQVLVDKKLIESPEYWLNVAKFIKYFDKLLINIANHIIKP